MDCVAFCYFAGLLAVVAFGAWLISMQQPDEPDNEDEPFSQEWS